jgi:hypothetical protein
MDEDVETEVGSCLPKWAQGFRVECLTLKLGGDDNAGEAELDGAPFEFGRRLLPSPMKRPG